MTVISIWESRVPGAEELPLLELLAWTAFTAATPSQHLYQLLNLLNDGHRQEHDLQISGGWGFHGRQIWRGCKTPEFLYSPGKGISYFLVPLGSRCRADFNICFFSEHCGIENQLPLMSLRQPSIGYILSQPQVNPGRKYTLLLTF